MCLIVDANMVGESLVAPCDAEFLPVYEGVMRGTARIVFGGKLTREYLRIKRFVPLLLELERSGRARKVDDKKVVAATSELVAAGRCRSDDQHIIALAQIGRVRLLCSHDQALIADFKDNKLLSKPGGSVYQKAVHARLILQHCKHP